MRALLDEIVRWASGCPDVRAVLLTGSHARGEADASSDLDVELYTTEPERYAGGEWMAEIRPVWVHLGFEPEPGRPTRNRLTIFATVARRLGVRYPDEVEEPLRGYAEAALDA